MRSRFSTEPGPLLQCCGWVTGTRIPRVCCTLALAKLFNFKKATELSERLSESPVADLNKAMSINDRLLYINELFGRDRTALDESLQLLNRFDAFEAARGFLINLAEQYRWGHEERIEIAQAFVKLVRRKYL